MTRVRAVVDRVGVRLEIRGHAGYAQANKLPAGCDIVCAAVSMLADTFYQRVMELEADGSAEVVEAIRESGNVRIRVNDRDEDERLAETTVTILTGYELLADRYPGYVSFEYEEKCEPEGWGKCEEKRGML